MHCVLYNPSIYSQRNLPLVPSPTSLTFSSQLSKSDLLNPLQASPEGEILLPIDCGNNQAILYLSRLCQGSKGPCILYNGYWLTPNEFQYISGRETAKDWKRSIRHNGKSIKLLISKGVITVHSPICECGNQTANQLGTRRMELLHNNSSTNHSFGQHTTSPSPRNGTSVKRESRLTSIIDHLLISRTNEAEYRSYSSSESESWGESSSTGTGPTVTRSVGGAELGGMGRGSASAGSPRAVSTSASPPASMPPQAASTESGEEEASGQTPVSASVQPTPPPHSAPLLTKSKSSKKQQARALIKNERQSPESIRSSPSPPKPGSGGASPPLKQMEQMMSRNYSDFMRSLAAKYNHSNPNDIYSSRNTNFTFDTRFLKPGAAAAAASLLAFQQQQQAAAEKLQFPLIDMSSTQTLLSMVRTAAANSSNSSNNHTSNNSSNAATTAAQQLLSSLPASGTSLKRASSPLDLSSAAALVGLSQPKKMKHSSSSSSSMKRCGSSCSGCSNEAEAVSGWTVEEVCRFVGSIDLCAEYVQAFRDHSIDGTSLPLLTEEHLIQNMNMKLGPALKFKSTVAKKLGNCPVCIHCLHCHVNPEPK